jgi:hypothetical protein
MNYWFIVHDLKAYDQHSDLIGSKIKQRDVYEPHSKLFGQIKQGDKIV